jgi:amidase
MDEVLRMSALEQAELVARREISSVELVRTYQDRIRRLDVHTRAFVTVFGQRALVKARLADAMVKRGQALGAFHGVPIGIKDLDPVRGSFSKMGSRAYAYLWSPVDGAVAKRLRRGGFVMLGKLATSEFGALPVTEPDIHAPTRNPWNLAHSSGGSSGGSGAAVAAGLVPIAQGSDGGGSIRIPACFGHLFGIKASRGALPNPYARLDMLGMVSPGPLAHTVEDAAAMLDLLRGDGPSERSFRVLMKRPPGALRVRFATDSPLGRPVEPDVAAAVRRVAAALQDLGHHVEESPMVSADLDEFLPIYQWQLARVPVLVDRFLQPATRWLRVHGRTVTDATARELAERLARKVDAWFGDVDLWVTPTVAVQPPIVGAWNDLEPEAQFLAASKLGDFTGGFNVSGHAAANIPSGLDRAGLPVGVQLVAPRGQDHVVLAVARQLETALPWRSLRSPIALK